MKGAGDIRLRPLSYAKVQSIFELSNLISQNILNRIDFAQTIKWKVLIIHNHIEEHDCSLLACCCKNISSCTIGAACTLEKYDAKRTYKKFLGYGPGIAVIDDMIVGIENRDGNTNVRFNQKDTLERIFNRLETSGIGIFPCPYGLWFMLRRDCWDGRG